MRRLREPDERVRGAVADDAALSERVDAGRDAGGDDAPRPGVPRLLADAGGAIGGRHGRRDDGALDRHALRRRHRSALDQPAPRARRSPRRSASAPTDRCSSEHSAADVADAAVRRAHVGRRRPAARGRARGGASLRRAADLRQERQPVARPAAAARRDPRVPRAGEGGGHRAGRLARQLSDQPRHHRSGAAAAVDRRDGRRARSRRGARPARRRAASGRATRPAAKPKG